MPATLNLNLRNGYRAERFGLKGLRIRQTGLFKGLTSTGDDAMIAEALAHPDLPAYNDLHPNAPSDRPAYLRDVAIIPVAPTMATCELTWETPDGAADDGIQTGGGTPNFVLRDSTTLEMSQTQVDANETKLEVQYSRKSGATVLWTRANVATHQLMVPRRTIVATAVMNSRPTSDMYACVGRVNDASWQGEDARKWLCAELASETRDGGNRYHVQATFIHNELTWDAWLAWVDEHGNIPADVEVITPGTSTIGGAYQEATNGFLRAVVYKVADFATAFGS